TSSNDFMNQCSWVAPVVTLFDGRQVASDSAEWQAQTEACTILAMPLPEREQFWLDIERKRGADALAELKARCFELEPHFVLNLPNKPQRNAYLAQVEHRFGRMASETLRV